jgi:hypothetical protein
MSASVPRTDPPAVEPDDADEHTQPELAPPVRPSPMGPHLPSPDPVRARRPTLVSPIPALLASSMSEVREDAREDADATPQPVDLRSEATSRFDATSHPDLMMGDDGDYVVEVDGKPPVSPR